MAQLSKQKIKEMIQNAKPLELELVWIPKIMENQTEDERYQESTIEYNEKGLNAFDAKTISYYFNQIKSGSHLTPEQVEKARVKLVKYAGQYAAMTA